MAGVEQNRKKPCLLKRRKYTKLTKITGVRSVVYVSAKQTAAPAEESDFASLLDPGLIRSARLIYTTFYEVHPSVTQRPLGVAIDRFTHRGKLIFSGKPILLPQECFVPFGQIEAEIY